MDTLVSIEVDGDVSIHLCFCDRDWEVQLYTLYTYHMTYISDNTIFPASNFPTPRTQDTFQTLAISKL